MRLKTISALLAGAMVAAVLISSHGAHDQLAMQAVLNRGTGTEVLKVHAIMQARLDVQLTQPDLPHMDFPSYRRSSVAG